MIQNIRKQLKEIEKNKSVKILFAVETGSRVWRLESKDSDYDVRYVYVRNIKDYLRINKLDEVIEVNKEDMDFVGFDIFKFSRLLLSSNPSIIEWLESDIIYSDDGKTKQFFKDFIERKFNPVALYYHYKSMCKQNYLKYLKSRECLTYKKYLYSMRGLINAKWVVQFKEVPPIDFNIAIKKIKEVPDSIINKLKVIIKIKKLGKEKDKNKGIGLFDNYIEEFLRKEDNVKGRKIIDYSEVQDYILNILGDKCQYLYIPFKK